MLKKIYNNKTKLFYYFCEKLLQRNSLLDMFSLNRYYFFNLFLFLIRFRFTLILILLRLALIFNLFRNLLEIELRHYYHSIAISKTRFFKSINISNN